ncbi:hypothetical protein PENTCL1PPCAC_19343, partial [Pristionchus entomophagus]
QHYRSFLSEADTNMLGKQLPTLGNQIWFTTHCEKHSTPPIINNERVVSGYWVGGYYNPLSILQIMHSSRLHE